MLLARMGLRSLEVANLKLDDVDWRRGEIVVHAKAHRECLPLPSDVGRALNAYLHDRPRASCRSVFLTVLAPIEGLAASGIGCVVRRACRRAGLPPFGAHRLRHTVATQMLNAGASLAEVGQVLRHRDPQTTAIYAKVDQASLRSVAQCWPGGIP
jgi:site-specific recombinase XerD